MNSVNLIGRLTSEPEVRYTSEGLAMTKFSLAVDRPLTYDKRKTLVSEGKSTADFPKIVAWGKQAENVGKYLKKGQSIGVSGRIMTGSWTREDGKKMYTTEISAAQIRFLPYTNKEKEEDTENELTEEIGKKSNGKTKIEK